MTRYRSDDRADLVPMLAQLTERVKNLEAGNRIGFTAISIGIKSASVSSAQITSSPTYTDLDTVGPVVPDVNIGLSGQCLVVLSATIHASDSAGSMSFAISGETSRNPTRDLELELDVEPSLTGTKVVAAISNMVSVVGLNPGKHTFTAKYAAKGSTTFQNRNMVVIPI